MTIPVPVVRPASFDVARALAYAQAAGFVIASVPIIHEPVSGMAPCAIIACIVVATSYEPRVESADAASAWAPVTTWRWMVAGLAFLAIAAAYISVFMTPRSNFTDGGPCPGPLHRPVATLFPPQVICVLGDSADPLVASHHFVALALIALPAAALMIVGLIGTRRRSFLDVAVGGWALFAFALGVSSAIRGFGVVA